MSVQADRAARLVSDLRKLADLEIEMAPVDLTGLLDEVRASEDSDALLIEVADTGAGVPADEIGQVWQELARGRAARSLPVPDRARIAPDVAGLRQDRDTPEWPPSSLAPVRPDGAR